MTEIQIAPDRTKLLVTLVRDGRTVARDRIDPGSKRAREKVCRDFGVEDTVLLSWTDEVKQAGSPKTFPLPEPPVATEPHFWVRKIDQPRGTPETGSPRAILQRLPSVPNDCVIEWEEQDGLCCLDIDYHDGPAPKRDWLSSLVYSRLSPRPVCWHFSRSGGLHLFYVSSGPFSAESLAAVSALRFRAIDETAGLELKSQVRGPGKEEVHTSEEQDTGGAVIGDWFGAEGDDTEARDAWLESEGMVIDGRYDHDKCPICPSEDAGAKRQPVTVSESGIFCFICSGKGRSLGCRRPGFAPWTAILGAPTAGDLGIMVRGLCHWGHAKWVLTERYSMPIRLARLAYQAALTARHTGTIREPLLPYVFNSDVDRLARSSNQWYDIEQSTAYPKDIQPLLSCLPAAKYVDEEGNIKTNAAAVCELNQTKDLSARGYPPIERIHGFRVAGVHQAPPRTQVAVINPDLSSRYRPKYKLATERMKAEEAWSVLEQVFPRLDRTLIRALLCAFGSAQETRSGLTPFFFVSGVSAAGKSSHVKIAAAIAGTRVGAEAVYDSDTTRFRQSIFEGAQRGPVVVINELLKDAGRRQKLSAREALDPLLNLTSDSTSWVAYRGPVSFGRVPVIAVTEPECPISLRDEKQIARRLRHHRVDGAKADWKQTLAACKLQDMHCLRAVSDRVSSACDSILSSVCDEYFAIPMSWDEQAEALGVHTLDEDPNFEDMTPSLIELFRLVCAAPELQEKQGKRVGKGYKKISRQDSHGPDSDDDLLALYTLFADGTGIDWLTARRLQEKDWAAILKADKPVRCDLKNDGANVFIRFRVGPALGAVVNGDIKIGV